MAENNEISKATQEIEELKLFKEEQMKKAIENPETFYLEVWNETVAFLKKYVEFSDEKEYHIITGWIMDTWISTYLDFYVYLHFKGVWKTGKTRAQELCIALSRNPVDFGNVSVSALFRVIFENGEPHTIFIDEFSLSPKSDNEVSRQILQILNVGYKKGGYVIRSRRVEDDFPVEKFPVFGFKCLAGSEPLPQTLRGRCITIRMRKTNKQYPLRIHKIEAEKLNIKLQICYRECLQNPKYWKVTQEIENLLFQTSQNDGRLVELFSSIYVVAPEQIKPIILEYMQECAELEKEEEYSSWEAQVLDAILETEVTNRFFSTKDVTEKFNVDRSEKEKIKSRTVGKQISTFGFKPFSNGKLRGWHWDEQLILTLKKRYNSNDGAEPKEQQTQLSTCWFCNQLIGESQESIADQYTKNKPVHKDCYLRLSDGLKGDNVES